MNNDPDYRKIHELISESNLTCGKLIELDDAQRDYLYAIDANSNNFYMCEDFNKKITHISETIKNKKSELLKQLEEIKKELEHENR